MSRNWWRRCLPPWPSIRPVRRGAASTRSRGGPHRTVQITPMRRTNVSRTKLAIALVPAALLIAACSSSGSPTTTTSAPPAAAAVTTTSAAPSPSAPAATTNASSDLAGSWSGQYSGAYSGTFALTWTQSGSSLNGTIKISGFGDSPETIQGTVDGSGIKFGTVGASNHVTYTGSFSGGSMSGNWQVTATTGSAGGSWSASKS